jgi:DNA-binding transcriptional LysR family regulator
MPRRLTLRQIEAFKAVIENGSISVAAQMVHISQPAMSKLIAHFEEDTGLKLFDRMKGRLALTDSGKRLYEEIDRIFAGVRQVENAAESIRRAERRQLTVGVMPAFSGSFIQRATTEFLEDRRHVFCSVQSLSSQSIVDWLVTRKLDVGLVEPGLDTPYLTIEPLMEHPLVCIMPLNHPLAAKGQVEPQDLHQMPFVSLNPDSYIGHRIESMFETYKVKVEVALVANVAPTLCEFVAAGFGISLVHPLVISGLEHRLVVRRFEPEILFNFQLCRSADSRNAQLVEAFAQAVRATAAQISQLKISES